MVLFALLKHLLVQNRLKHVQIVKSPLSHVMESDARFSGHKAAVCRTETARYRQLETNIYGKRCDNQRFEVSLSILSSF